ncbi:CAP-associated domain-containing protein [Gracilibacillus xinjiangensis]|uniref:CAP-associated domain-containing protein n=1 Tax=Gracilibacillus xinjiangensis TaxID=1193282 RepID=A0ABV8WXU1_9BACI
MGKLKFLSMLIIVLLGIYYFYGDEFQQSGITGVSNEIKDDVQSIIEHPQLHAIIDTINQEFQLLRGRIENLGEENKDTKMTDVEKPDLSVPSSQTFSIYNIELGDTKAEVENEIGNAKRNSLNEYGVDWYTYHENYQNFVMVAYNANQQVAGLYTNQNLLTSTNGLTIGSERNNVRSALGDPIDGIRKGFTYYQTQNNEEYDTFLIDQNYVTIFYDLHQGETVTAVQIISADLESEKAGFFADPSDQLRQGFESQLFDLTNAARVVHGKRVLAWTESVKETARHHSEDMASNNYFSHTNLDGETPFDRLTSDGIDYRMAGENLAAGQSSSIFAHEGLMNSLGHRKNILKGDYHSLAVGVAFGSDARPFYTENFITP